MSWLATRRMYFPPNVRFVLLLLRDEDRVTSSPAFGLHLKVLHCMLSLGCVMETLLKSSVMGEGKTAAAGDKSLPKNHKNM